MFKKITHKRIISLVLAAVMLLTAAVLPASAATTSKTKNTPKEVVIGVSLTSGKTTSLAAYFLPSGTKDTFTWSSGDNKVATVDSKGTVKAVSKGTAIITVKGTKSGTAAKLVINVTAAPEKQPPLVPTEPVVERPASQYITDILPAYQKSSNDYVEYSAAKSIAESGIAKSFTMGGEKYTDGFTFIGSEEWAVWNLGGKYTSLRGVLCHVDGTNTGAYKDAALEVFCDGVFQKRFMVSGDMAPKDISINLSGVKQLKIIGINSESSNKSDYYWDGGIYGIGNPILT